MYDVVIIGAGVAGMTAAIYARRANKKVLILEEKVCGGQIVETKTINNYPAAPHISGPELAHNIFEQVKTFEPELRYEKVEEVREVNNGIKIITSEDEYETETVIVATGTDYRQIGLKNEEELAGRGVSYCATCDGSIYKDKEVAVFGGGNSALYSALYLADLAKKVTLIHRREEFRADASLVDRAREKGNILFEKGQVVSELRERDGVLDSIILKNVADDGEKELPVSALFVEIGRVPTGNRIIKDLVEFDDQGYIKAGEDGKTSNPRIFAAGDCRTKGLRQVVTAAADGAAAATSAVDFINSL